MLNNLLVRTALLIGPKIEIHDTRSAAITIDAWTLARENTDEVATVIRHTDSVRLSPRPVHLRVAAQALGCSLNDLDIDGGCVWHTSGVPDKTVDIKTSDASGRVTKVRHIIQNCLGNPKAALSELTQDFSELIPDERARDCSAYLRRKYDIERIQNHARRIERLLCARNPLSPRQAEKRLIRIESRPRHYQPTPSGQRPTRAMDHLIRG